MNAELICYKFAPSVPIEDVESSLLLALLGTESLHGETSARLAAPHHLDRNDRRVVIDASTELGMDFNRLFLGFVTREFGTDAVAVQRIATQSSDSPAGPPPSHGFPPAEWN